MLLRFKGYPVSGNSPTLTQAKSTLRNRERISYSTGINRPISYSTGVFIGGGSPTPANYTFLSLNNYIRGIFQAYSVISSLPFYPSTTTFGEYSRVQRNFLPTPILQLIMFFRLVFSFGPSGFANPKVQAHLQQCSTSSIPFWEV